MGLKSKLGLLWLPIVSILLAVACQPQPTQVFIEVDGGRQALTTEATTVREALAEARISLETLDRVDPDLYTQLEPGLVIVVTRVREDIETRREIIPFERQVVTNEALAAGETRLVQLGVNGEEEITIRIVYENGVEASRTEVARTTVIEAEPEILVTGVQGNLPEVPIAGTIAYLSNGNAWLMRDSSGSRRALTSEGKLDGRVLSLAPDGRRLVYTTKLTDEIDLPLNELWLASTTIVGEPPLSLSIQGVLQAAWSPVITESRLAYTTAARVANPPGWKANNDLWLLDLNQARPAPQELLPPSTAGLYPWWGTTFTWSPQGNRLAYARADQIGVVDLTISKTLSSTVSSLVDFVPLTTFSEWVWTPGLSWSPDGQFLAAAVHGPPVAGEPAAESQVFDLWLLDAAGVISARVATQVGMWANPAWGPAGIAFGEAINPLQSASSRYRLQLIDRDGSNKRQLFPFQEEPGVQFPELAWSPDGKNLLFIFNGNLYLTGSDGAPPQQLTIDGQASRPQWVARAPVITATAGITGALGLNPRSGDVAVSPTPGMGATPGRGGPPPTATPTFAITNSLTITPLPSSRPTSTLATATPFFTATVSPTSTVTRSVSTDND
ncbi:MAG: G5 domain-containing protein [Chloroflexota bacterium]